MVKMRTQKKATSGDSGPPYVGALLRIGYQRVRAYIDEDIRAAGFSDLQEAHFAVFSWPPPDGVRLSQLARQIGMSRQATHYLVGQLEELGYLERRAAPGTERRLIYMTERSRKVQKTIWTSLRTLQAQWANEIGHERFNAFMEVLRELQQAPTSGVRDAKRKTV